MHLVKPQPENEDEIQKEIRVVDEFIEVFFNHPVHPDGDSVIHYQFRSGYCWHFAHMLKTVFGDRGVVCWTAPLGHFVWYDTKTNTCFDIEGIYNFLEHDVECLIPETYLTDDHLNNFKHVKSWNTHYTDTEEENQIIQRYKKDVAEGKCPRIPRSEEATRKVEIYYEEENA